MSGFWVKKGDLMRKSILSRLAVFAATASFLGTQAYAWSISGNVKSDKGDPLAGVKISSFNFPSVSATTDFGGAFSFDENTAALLGVKIAKPSLTVENGILNIDNVNANVLKLSMIDALGKVIYQRTLQQVHGSITLDMNKYSARGTKFVRINIDGNNTSYLVTSKGALLKEGDLLPSFFFVKDGYKSVSYQMQQEDETGVNIVMEEGSEIVTGSSNSFHQPDQSSSSIASSSSKIEVPTDCSGKTLKSNTSLTIDGRKVIVKFPNGYTGNKPVPLLINYHPIGGSADGWESQSAIAKEALADGAIVIFPDGQGGAQMMGRSVQAWNVGPCCTDADDVKFTRDFVKELTEKACVDPTRIYAAGFSMGGGMSNYAGCYLADIIAAAAPSAFDLAREIVDNGLCKPARPYPILNFRGTQDNIVMYEGGLSQVVTGKPITFMGAENNFKEWAKMNGCKGNPKQNTPGNNCQMYEECDGGAKVGLCTIQGGGHSEGDAKMGWEFVKQFRLE